MINVKLPVQHTIELVGELTEEGTFKDFGGLKIKLEGSIVEGKFKVKLVIDTTVNYSDVVLLRWIENARSKV
jgi:hypothetical protein